MKGLKELELFFAEASLKDFSGEKEAWAYVTDYLHSSIGAEASTFFLADEAKKFLTFSFVKGPNSQELEGISFSYTGAAGWCAVNRKAVLIKDAQNNPLFSSKVDYATRFKTRSIMVFPCFCGSALSGVAEFINPQNRESFSDEDFSFAFSCLAYFSKLVYSLKLEITVRELSARADSAINNLSGGFAGIDNSEKIIFFNPKAAEILSVTDPQIGLNLDKAMLPCELKTALRKTLREKEQIKRAEFAYKSPGGVRRIGYSTLNLKTVDGSIDGAGVIFQDITGV